MDHFTDGDNSPVGNSDIRANTRPAAAIGWEDRLGTLRVGSEADIALLRMEEGPVTLVDALGEKRTGRVLLRPEATVRAGIVFRPSS